MAQLAFRLDIVLCYGYCLLFLAVAPAAVNDHVPMMIND